MKHLLTSLFLIAICYSTIAQEKTYKLVCIGFYNLENLFDTIVDPDTSKILQDDFTPDGAHAYTAERYQQKLENLSLVISKMGTEMSPDGPAILGVSEIENRQVLEDLVKMPLIKDRNYKIAHYESPDRRGIDVGLLYQEKYFTLESTKSIKLHNPEDPDFRTRDQLLVSGELDGERMHFMVAHWPSRRGGQKRSAPKRVLAAQTGKAAIDSIKQAEPNAKVIYMGDLNDDPTNGSVKDVFNTKSKPEKVTKDAHFFNPMEPFFKKGIGTLAWRDSWNLFDQLICTKPLVTAEKDYSTYKFYKAVVYNEEFLKNKEGSYKGYPKRTYVGTTWQGGYSDHFPVYLYLIKENN